MITRDTQKKKSLILQHVLSSFRMLPQATRLENQYLSFPPANEKRQLVVEFALLLKGASNRLIEKKKQGLQMIL